jgi:hypothetical protein
LSAFPPFSPSCLSLFARRSAASRFILRREIRRSKAGISGRDARPNPALSPGPPPFPSLSGGGTRIAFPGKKFVFLRSHCPYTSQG